MKKRSMCIILMIVIICICFAGCDVKILSANDLIRPPKLSGESNFLQAEFEKIVNNDFIEMKTPITGKNRSSYIIFDIDADGNDDALVFYSDPSINEFARVAVFKSDGNSWKNISNIVGLAEEIYEVSFNDINGDGKYEVLISWTSLGPNSYTNETLTLVGNRILTLYTYSDTAMDLQKTEHYTKMYVSDFDSDGSDDIFLTTVNISIDSNKTDGRIISFNKDLLIDFDKTFSLVGMLDIVSIASDSVQTTTGINTRIYIDGLLSDAAYVTDIVQLSSNKELSLLLHDDVDNPEVPSTARSNKVYSCDIDSDGIVEVPTLQELPYSKRISDNEGEASVLNLVVWSQLNESELKVDLKTLYNKAKNYYFKFDDAWLTNITAYYNANTSLLTFYSVNNGEPVEELFSVITFSSSAWEENKNEFYLLYDNGAYVYGYTISPNSEFTKQDILNNFVVMS